MKHKPFVLLLLFLSLITFMAADDKVSAITAGALLHAPQNTASEQTVIVRSWVTDGVDNYGFLLRGDGATEGTAPCPA